MGLFSSSKKKTETAVHKRSEVLTVSNHERLTAKAARISFEVPAEMADSFSFTPGQYLNLHCNVNGTVLNRSYSICSAPGEPLSVAVKAVEGGVCCTCKARILEGTARMDVNYALEKDEVEAGYVLTCQAHPTSEKLIVSFDD